MAILLIHCPHIQGIVTEFMYINEDIIFLNQYANDQNKISFIRFVSGLISFLIPEDKISDYFNTQIFKN